MDLLGQIGIAPDLVLPADIDETPRRGELPADYARRMALEKPKPPPRSVRRKAPPSSPVTRWWRLAA